MLPATSRMGITTINLNAEVRRLSLRSGYSTENRTGYAGSLVWLLDSMAAPPPVARSTAAPLNGPGSCRERNRPRRRDGCKHELYDRGGAAGWGTDRHRLGLGALRRRAVPERLWRSNSSTASTTCSRT